MSFEKNFSETCQTYGVEGGTYQPGQVSPYLIPKEQFSPLLANAVMSYYINDPDWYQNGKTNFFSSGSLICNSSVNPKTGESVMGCADINSILNNRPDLYLYCKKDGEVVGCFFDENICQKQTLGGFG